MSQASVKEIVLFFLRPSYLRRKRGGGIKGVNRQALWLKDSRIIPWFLETPRF